MSQNALEELHRETPAIREWRHGHVSHIEHPNLLTPILQDVSAESTRQAPIFLQMVGIQHHPGQWFLISTYSSPESAHVSASRLRTLERRPPTDQGTYTFAAAGEFLYARWDGEAPTKAGTRAPSKPAPTPPPRDPNRKFMTDPTPISPELQATLERERQEREQARRAKRKKATK